MFKARTEEAREARKARAEVGRDLLSKLDELLRMQEAEHRQQFLEAGCSPDRVDDELQTLRWQLQAKMMRELDARAREIALRKAAAVRDQRHAEEVSGEPRP